MNLPSLHTACEEEIPCPACGSREFSILIADAREHSRDLLIDRARRYSSASFDRAHGRIVSCMGCGLVFINPRPPAVVVTGAYREAVDPVYLADERAREATMRRLLRLVEKFERRGTLLDVGCAAGYFVKTARGAGWSSYGVEPAHWLANLGRERFRLDIGACTLREARYPDGRFDVVTFWDTLEHMPEPLDELREANRVVKDGGHLFISFPNIACPLVKIFGRYHWWFTPGHLLYFSRRTLSRMIEKAGFTPVQYHLYFPYYSLGYLAERLAPYSPRLKGAIQSACRLLHMDRAVIPCYTSQMVLVAVKAARRNMSSQP